METLNLFDLFAKISLDTSEYDSGVKDVTKSGSSLASKLKSGLASAGKAAAVGIGAITTAAGAAVGGLLALEQSTEEYRIAMGRLNTAFESAGYSVDTAQQAYRAFYGILGDTDTATEASQLLASLADSAEDVSVWTNIAAGVNGTFGDSLPIEGLIEAANETANVGTVTGVLADALNWVGISEDEFNTKLAECSTESERNQLIMSTLAAQYDSAADSFYRNNEALVASRDSQSQMQTVTANLGAAIGNIKTAVTSSFTPAITEAAAQATEFINNIDPQDVVSAIQGLISAFQTLLPVITGVTAATVAYKAAVAIAGIIDSVKNATQGMTIAQTALNAVMNANPFVLVATLIAGVGTALLTLYATNEEFRSGVQSAWNKITSTISGAVSTIVNFFTVTIPNAAQTAVDWLKGIPEQMRQVGQDLLMGLWNGISDKVQWLKDKVSGVVDTIKSWFTGSDGFDEHSPSKWAKQVFRYVMEGGGQGLEAGLPGLMSDVQNVTNRVKNGMDFGTANVDFASSGLGTVSANSSKNLSALQGYNSQDIIINLTAELDGAILARKQYRYSQKEAILRGTSLVEAK